MTSARPARFDLAPLGHPLWWGALALLLVNDNLLKGAGVVPGWLTGKLSDFAFLIVAPVLLGSLLPRAMPGRRPLAVALVTGLFAAADLSGDVSDAVVAAAARVGLVWRLWPDPTDLLALAVLPVAIWLMYRGGMPSAGALRGSRERGGVLLGAAACLATSAPPSYTHHPFLLNATASPETVRVTWLLRKLALFECEAPEMLAAGLNPSDLEDSRDLRLESGQVALMAGLDPSGTSPVGVCSTNRGVVASGACAAAIVEAPSAQPVLMVALPTWNEYSDSGGSWCGGDESPPPRSLCRPTLDPAADPGPDALSLRDGSEGRIFVAGANIRIIPIDPAAIAARTPSTDGCRALREEYRTLIESRTCATDADCAVGPGRSIPGAGDPCDVYVNADAAGRLGEIADRWAGDCATDNRTCTLQPPACRNGLCEAVCPGVDLPFCPPPCAEVVTDEGSCAGRAYRCRQDDLVCLCDDGPASCVQLAPAAPTCPVGCLIRSGEGRLVGVSNPDGGGF